MQLKKIELLERGTIISLDKLKKIEYKEIESKYAFIVFSNYEDVTESNMRRIKFSRSQIKTLAKNEFIEYLFSENFLDRTEYDFDYVNWYYFVGYLLGIAQRKTAEEAKIEQHKQIFEWVQSKKITFQNYIDLNILFPLNNFDEQNSNTETNELKRTY